MSTWTARGHGYENLICAISGRGLRAPNDGWNLQKSETEFLVEKVAAGNSQSPVTRSSHCSLLPPQIAAGQSFLRHVKAENSRSVGAISRKPSAARARCVRCRNISGKGSVGGIGVLPAGHGIDHRLRRGPLSAVTIHAPPRGVELAEAPQPLLHGFRLLDRALELPSGQPSSHGEIHDDASKSPFSPASRWCQRCCGAHLRLQIVRGHFRRGTRCALRPDPFSRRLPFEESATGRRRVRTTEICFRLGSQRPARGCADLVGKQAHSARHGQAGHILRLAT